MFIVRNLTNKLIILSDIRVEIAPYRIVDIESITTRENIERSSNLKNALASKTLQLVKQTVIRVPVKIEEPHIIERTIEKQTLDEDRLRELVRSVIKETLEANASKPIEETVSQAIAHSMSSVMDTLRNKLGSVNVGSVNDVSVPDIDPTKLAEIQQKAVEKISSEIESNKKQGKRIKIEESQSKISDLANEL